MTILVGAIAAQAALSPVALSATLPIVLLTLVLAEALLSRVDASST